MRTSYSRRTRHGLTTIACSVEWWFRPALHGTLAAGAAAQVFGPGPIAVHDLRLHAPLLLEDLDGT